MKTEVVMQRRLFGNEIGQSSKTKFFSATDLVNAGNKWRRSRDLPIFNLSAFFNNKKTKEFIGELQNKYGIVSQKGRSKNSQTWVHPLLFIDIALAISPELKVETYEWLLDNLIEFRNDSGDSYKEMSGRLYVRFDNNREFPKFISETASKIKKSCGVKDWQTATQEQLKKRDLIHNSIKTLCNVLKNAHEAVRIGIEEHANL